MPEDFPPGGLSEILSGENAPLIVGGQAVNIWAELYAPRMLGELDEFEPFTSRDADIYGDRMLAETLAKRKGWECHFMDDPASAAIAILKKSAGPNSPELTIEVLREVNGLTEEDLALTTTIELTGGEQYLIPSPIVLLKSNSIIWFHWRISTDLRTCGTRKCSCGFFRTILTSSIWPVVLVNLRKTTWSERSSTHSR